MKCKREREEFDFVCAFERGRSWCFVTMLQGMLACSGELEDRDDSRYALKAAGQIRVLSNFDSKDYTACPYDPNSIIKVDDDLRKLFRSGD
ncbi:hypothetical protein SADUNF_Sadunf16G0194800 [Salix dunnii]|uniref:Uncharacterized protein n=1 Tax=Salix dunnii TaxID=1413687 RepID=A0A835MGZ0_9ROSI|nr:hypothetical protein SADUNF_Sadunf16G0194800 [Salix dunnii]